MSLAFASQLGLKIQKTNVEVQKIDNTTLKTSGIVVPTSFLSNKDIRKRVFKKSFSLANVIPNVVLEMLFLTISNAKVDFRA